MGVGWGRWGSNAVFDGGAPGVAEGAVVELGAYALEEDVRDAFEERVVDRAVFFQVADEGGEEVGDAACADGLLDGARGGIRASGGALVPGGLSGCEANGVEGGGEELDALKDYHTRVAGPGGVLFELVEGDDDEGPGSGTG